MPQFLHRLVKLPEHAPLLSRIGVPARFRILLRVLPVVALVVGIRAALQLGLPSFQGLIASSTVTPFAAAAMFLLALLLAGVLEDYKVSVWCGTRGGVRNAVPSPRPHPPLRPTPPPLCRRRSACPPTS
jgi:hypothetical protein